MKILTIVGARPQFIKAAPVSRRLRDAGIEEFILHTGQHYDDAMSKVFFDELDIPAANLNLAAGSGTHAGQTAKMMTGIEAVVVGERPDWVVVYGDTNSTLAGAITVCKLGIRLAHIEAGLRSFNRTMPEELNRVVADHCADALFCPTETAVDNLKHEGIVERVCRSGDTMYDSVLQFGNAARERSPILRQLGLEPKHYVLATIHRHYNTDDVSTLSSLIRTLDAVDETVVFPVHPRTRARLNELGFHSAAGSLKNLRIVDPVSYLDMLQLEQNARVVVTDSGGVQKEAYFFAVPCITARPETEWKETLEGGWNILAGTGAGRLAELIKCAATPALPPRPLFGDGHAAEAIVRVLNETT